MAAPSPFGKMGDLLVMLPLLYAMNQIDFTTEQAIFGTRAAFALALMLQFAAIAWMYQKISAKGDMTKIKVPETPALGSPPPAAGSEIETTVVDYDLQQLKKVVTQLGMSMAIIGFLHLNWGYTQPLFIQSFMGPINLFKHALVKIYLLGETGNIENRPFEEPNPLAAFMPKPTAPPAEDAATITPATETAPVRRPKKQDNKSSSRVEELPDETSQESSATASKKDD